MLREAIEKVEELTEYKRRPFAYTRQEIGSGKLIVQPDAGSATSVLVASHPVYQTTSVDAFCAAVKAYALDGATIWVGEDEVLAVLSEVSEWNGFGVAPEVDALVLEPHRPPLATLPVELMPLLGPYAELRTRKPGEAGTAWPVLTDQKHLNRFLSFELAHAKIEPDIREVVRKIRWASSDELNREIRQGGDAMGRSVRAEAAGATEFPERVKIHLDPIFKPAAGFVQVTVEAMFVVDASERAVGLIPLPGEIERARNAALRQLARQIAEKLPTFESRIFLGHPVL